MEDLKRHLQLYVFDPELDINIYSDAAKTGWFGFVMTQPNPQDSNRQRGIYHGSMGLTDAKT